MKIKFLKLLTIIMLGAFIAGAAQNVYAAEKSSKKSPARTKKTAVKKTDKKKKPANDPEKAAENADLKAIYDKQMIEAVKLFSQKKNDLSKTTRAELEDILTIAAAQAREGNYEDAIYVINEIETILSGRKKQSKTIKIEDAATGETRSYQFDVNKNNKLISANENEESSSNSNDAVYDEEAASTTPPDGKFSLKRLSAAEQKLYKDLVEVLPIAEFEFNKKKNPDTARRLMRLRRVFYTLKKKGMGFSVDDKIIQELISENEK